MADDTQTTETTGTAAADYSFLPDTFKGEDGAYDTDGFMASYNEAVSFKAQADETAAALPQEPAGYEIALSDEFQLPEGFEIPKQLDDDGNEVDFDVKSLLNADDPDIAAVQSMLHEAKVDPALGGKLAELMVGRELRQMMAAAETRTAETKKLGPQAEARISTTTRTLETLLPKEQVSAVLDGITSADGLRAVETLLKNSKAPVSPAGGNGPDMESMSNLELLQLGAQQQKRA